MQHFKVAPKGASRNETIGGRSDDEAGPPGPAIEFHRLLEDGRRQRTLHNREAQKRILGDSKRRLVLKTLENFLHNGKARDHGIQVAARRGADVRRTSSPTGSLER
jgi:hypothetical protein